MPARRARRAQRPRGGDLVAYDGVGPALPGRAREGDGARLLVEGELAVLAGVSPLPRRGLEAALALVLGLGGGGGGDGEGGQAAQRQGQAAEVVRGWRP